MYRSLKYRWRNLVGLTLAGTVAVAGAKAHAGVVGQVDGRIAIHAPRGRLTSLTPTATAGNSSPKVAVDGSGVIHVVYQVFEHVLVPEGGEFAYSRSSDGGVTWEGVSCYGRRSPAVAVAPDGTVTIASVRCGDVGHGLLGEAVVYERLTAGPPLWQFDSWCIDVQEGIGAQYSGFFGPPSLALRGGVAAPSGALFFYEFSRPAQIMPSPRPEEGNLRAWKSAWEPFPAPPVDLLVSGVEHTFQAPSGVSYLNGLLEAHASCILHVHRAAADSLVHVYERAYGGEWVNGATLGTCDTSAVREPVHGVASGLPEFPDPPQRLHAAWVEEGVGGLPRIYHRRATYDHLSEEYLWASPTAVGTEGVSASHPVIAQKRGVPMVVWETENAAASYEIYWSYWNGTAWETPLNLSESPNVDSRYPHICYVPNADPRTGCLHVIWTEPWQGIWEVRYRRLFIAELPGEEPD